MQAKMKNQPQTDRTVDLWRAVEQTDQIVSVLVGMFEEIGITIEETGEKLTARVKEGTIQIDPGLPEKYDLLAPLKLENVHEMVLFTADGRLDESEIWRIIAVLFTPLTRETLRTPVMSKAILRKLAGIVDLIHVQLLGPEAEHVANYTLAFVSRQWLVIRGSHGQARRKFTLTSEEYMTYQKRVFNTIKANNFLGWMRFARWYAKWRPSVSPVLQHD